MRNEIKDGSHLGLSSIEAWNEYFSSCACVYLCVAPVHTCEMETQVQIQAQGNEQFLALALAFAFAVC